MRNCLACLILVPLLLPLLAGPGPVPFNFAGIIRDPTGAGLSGASVVVERWEWDRSMRYPRAIAEPVVRTDEEGRFSAYLPPGLYDVFVSYPSMEPVAKKIEIKAVESTNLDCTLELSSLAPTAGGLEIGPHTLQARAVPPARSSRNGCVD
jgi:hypothetical protein